LIPGGAPTLEQVVIERLRPDPANPRQIEAAELDALTRSIRQYGFVEPIVATRDGLVVAGDRDQSDVWEIPKPTASPLHPAQEPLAVLERAIVNSSRPGALILDPFAGSGSTLIACERTGRMAALIELDPIYCDVIIARWEAFTGHPARLVTGLDTEPAEGGR
jgi:hypothetical protein